MPYTDTIDTFRQLVSAGVNNVTKIKALFVPDDPGQGGPPNVGLTTGGPQFNTQDMIGSLFTALFTSFPNLVLRYPTAVRPADGNTVVVEAVLTTGAHVADWAPNGGGSPPISNIHHAGRSSVDLPVCAVFLFYPASSKIQNLALYFDRWRLAQDLWDKTNPPQIDK